MCETGQREEQNGGGVSDLSDRGNLLIPLLSTSRPPFGNQTLDPAEMHILIALTAYDILISISPIFV